MTSIFHLFKLSFWLTSLVLLNVYEFLLRLEVWHLTVVCACVCLVGAGDRTRACRECEGHKGELGRVPRFAYLHCHLQLYLYPYSVSWGLRAKKESEAGKRGRKMGRCYSSTYNKQGSSDLRD